LLDAEASHIALEKNLKVRKKRDLLQVRRGWHLKEDEPSLEGVGSIPVAGISHFENFFCLKFPKIFLIMF
jgi:hypothetical protein